MAGQGSRFAELCVSEGFIGTDYDLDLDLTGDLVDDWRQFNEKFRPVYLEKRPEKSKIAAGLACGMTWTVAKGLHEGAIVITPDGQGHYHVGKVTGPYFYAPGKPLFHRRPVAWYPDTISRADMSEALRNSTNSTGAVCDISGYAEELESLIGGHPLPSIFSTDESVEDAASFALEKQLEQFLVDNWNLTELGRDYDIFEEDGVSGQQFQTDTGPMDILAVSKDKSTILVVELKKGRASDAVVGQIQRYMGYANSELAEDHQTVRGVIIALEDDLRIRRALSVAQGIEFYRYEISFKLVKQEG